MKTTEAEILLNKYNNGTASAKEILLLQNWYAQESIDRRPVMQQDDYLQMKKEVWQQILHHRNQNKPLQKQARLWPRISVAAAMAILLFGAALFFYQKKQTSPFPTTTYANDITPGSVGATLTLANGKKIKLSDATNGELAKEAGVTITKSADGELVYDLSSRANAKDLDPSKVGMTNLTNTLSTAKGETYKVRLPDGSLIWLNAASTLTYSTKLLQNGIRTVKIEGEGYFDIAKDRQHPFVVQTNNQSVQVLGTQFNINSYSNEPLTKTTLIEGSVQLSTTGGQFLRLKPGEQSILNQSGQMSTASVDTDQAVAWKEGYFQFDNETLESIMRKVTRWYDIEVEYKDDKLKSLGFGGTVSKYKNVSQVLKTLQLTNLVHFKIEGRKIIISAGNH